VVVSGLLKRSGQVFTQVVSDMKSSRLILLIHRKVKPDSVVCPDGYGSHDVLGIRSFHHRRINPPERFAVGKTPINGIENFWNQAKRVLRKYKGIKREFFPLFLKEWEFRFNYGSPRRQLNTLLSWGGI
jgi:transposase